MELNEVTNYQQMESYIDYHAINEEYAIKICENPNVSLIQKVILALHFNLPMAASLLDQMNNEGNLEDLAHYMVDERILNLIKAQGMLTETLLGILREKIYNEEYILTTNHLQDEEKIHIFHELQLIPDEEDFSSLEAVKSYTSDKTVEFLLYICREASLKDLEKALIHNFIEDSNEEFDPFSVEELLPYIRDFKLREKLFEFNINNLVKLIETISDDEDTLSDIIKHYKLKQSPEDLFLSVQEFGGGEISGKLLDIDSQEVELNPKLKLVLYTLFNPFYNENEYAMIKNMMNANLDVRVSYNYINNNCVIEIHQETMGEVVHFFKDFEERFVTALAGKVLTPSEKTHLVADFAPQISRESADDLLEEFANMLGDEGSSKRPHILSSIENTFTGVVAELAQSLPPITHYRYSYQRDSRGKLFYAHIQLDNYDIIIDEQETGELTSMVQKHTEDSLLDIDIESEITKYINNLNGQLGE